jgi:probable rRNA maturation factor
MKDAVQAIQFHYMVPSFYFPRRSSLKTFIYKQLMAEGKEIEAINYIFCDDAYLLQMNQQYLEHDTLTDIITFELSAQRQPLLSDIFISVERVRENASLFHTSFSKELHRVIFHGALHLAGYKDKKHKEQTRMREKENEWMSRYYVPQETVPIRNNRKLNSNNSL